MKKVTVISILLLMIVVMVTISSQPITVDTKKVSEQEIMEYNYNPSTILENVYQLDGLNILPFIYQSPYETVEKEEIEDGFKELGITINSISTPIIATGTEIVTDDMTYHVLIYGDVDKDGVVDGFDAQEVIDHFISVEGTLTGLPLIAANVENDDDAVDGFDAQRIIDFYIGEEPKLLLNDELPDSVDNDYITGIEITKNPSKISYVEGENIVLDGMTVNAIRTTGTESISIENLTTNPNVATVGTNIIEVIYTTTDTVDGNERTFSKTFEIYVAKKLSTVNVTVGESKGYIYEDIQIATIESGDNEEAITKKNLTWDILKDDEIVDSQVANITIEEGIVITDPVTMYLNAKEEGTYKITPKVGDASGKQITVTVTENPFANKVIVTSDLTQNIKLGKTKILSLEFFHEYAKGIEKEVSVQYKNITVEGMKFELLKGDTILDQKDDKNEFVDAILLMPETAGEKQKVTITLYSNTDNEKVITNEVNVVSTELELIVDAEDISLYLEDQDGEFVREEADGNIYTLIPVYLKDTSDGERINITKQNIADETIKIEDSKYANNTSSVNYISVKLYKDDNGTITEIPNNASGADYIGIAPAKGNEEELRNQKVVFTYNKTQIIELPIILPMKQIEEITVTPKSSAGYIYENIKIAEVESGENEIDVTAKDLEWKILKDNKEVNIDDAYIIEEEGTTEGSPLTIYLYAKETGEYSVTLTVGEILEEELVITVTENQNLTVDKINCSITENETLVIGNNKQFDLEFLHEYEDGVETEVPVQANKVTVTGIEYQLIGSSGSIIEDTGDTVDAILLTPTTTGEKQITITVGDASIGPIKVNVIENTTETELVVEADGNIMLYTTLPENEELVKEVDGSIYTLVPIYLKSGDDKIQITQKDITDGGSIQIIDSSGRDFDFPITIPLLFKTDASGNIVPVESTEEKADYIGISMIELDEGIDLDTIFQDQTIDFIYNNKTITLNIQY